MQNYYTLETLDVYKYCRDYSREAWDIYKRLSWQLKKVMGDQYLRSSDSVGANLAEGYGRFHYLDKIRFYYNARGSLLESKYWLDLLHERNIIKSERHQRVVNIYNNIHAKLNGLISSTYKNKQGN